MANIKVLIVDDEEIMRHTLNEQLSVLTGIDTAGEASSRQEAIRLIEETRPDLVLMDINLETPSEGIEAARQIRERFNLPVVYLTGLSEEKTLERARLTDPYGYLVKPYELRELHAAIEIAMQRFRIEEELKSNELQLDRENAVLVKIGQIVNSSLDIEEMYESFVEEARKLISFDRIIITIVENESNAFRVAYAAGIDAPNHWPDEFIPLAGSVTEELVRTRSGMILAQDEYEDSINRFSSSDIDPRGDLHSFLSVPMTSRGEVIGGMHLSSGKPEAYTDYHLALAEKIGAQIAMTVANSQLFAKITQIQQGLKQLVNELAHANEDLMTGRLEQQRLQEAPGKYAMELAQSGFQLSAEIEKRRLAEKTLQDALDELERRLEERTTRFHVASKSLQREISERKRSDEERQKLISLVENSSDFIFLASPEGQITYINEAGQKLIGAEEPSEAYSKRIPDIHDEEQTASIENEVLPSILQHGHWEGELGLKHVRSGAVVPVLANCFSIRDERTGAVIALAEVSRDITERKQAEAELNQAKQVAETMNRAKTEFLANMSHEIRTPLNGIVGMIDLMYRTGLTARQLEHLEMMKISADSLLGVINDILDVSKIEAGKLDLETVNFSLRDLMNKTMDMLGLRAQEKGLELVSNIQPELPDALVGDPYRLRQVIVNLVGNAIKFTDRGNVRVWVDMESQEEHGIVCHFAVVDTGIGIPAEQQEVIFEGFQQGDTSTTRKYGGTGLGLTISSRLVELMGGRIWLESEVGKGSTFHFTARLGLRRYTTTTSTWSSDTGDDALATNPLLKRSERHLKILLAEDNRINQALAIATLGDWGHHVVVANDGEEVLMCLESECFDLVLMDIQMPRMDGVEATRAIREREKVSGGHVMIAAMTAHAMMGDRERYLEEGMDFYIPKPIKERELLQIIESIEAGPPEDDPDEGVEQNKRRSIDVAAALSALGGKEQRLKQMATIFLEDCPGYLDNLRGAMASRDSSALAQIAHSIKGAVGIFAANAASDAALRLEKMGRAGDLTDAPEVCNDLEEEVKSLQQALTSLLEE